MARKTEAYVDTSAFIAFLDRSDSDHNLFRRLFANPPPLLTSALVIAEGHGWFLRRYDGNRAGQFLQFVQELRPLKIRGFGDEDLTTISRFLQKFRDQKLTITDAHGLALMEERRIQVCWSTDRHLGLTGVPLVI
jgi:predicted nucleic acid-binding protein